MMSSMSPEEADVHDKTVGLVAKKRFPFPNDEHPNWRTYTNHPVPAMGIKVGTQFVHPDIVVVDAEGKIVMLAEVETDSTVNPASSSKWKDDSSICSVFFLYVPEEFVDEAGKLLTENGIPFKGLRAYSYSFSIRDV